MFLSLQRRPTRATVVLMGCFVAAPLFGQEAENEFDAEHWDLSKARVVPHLDRSSLCGEAVLKNVVFENGVIEVDVAVTGRRSYPGILFRMQSPEEYERFYIRPHRASLYPDALQYTPVFNGVACWQLYHGEGFTAGAVFPEHEWFRLKLEVRGTQARVLVGDAEEPALVIPELKHGLSRGAIGLLGPGDGSAFFSNFRYRSDDELPFDAPPEPPPTPAGTITEWQVSKPLPLEQVAVDRYPRFYTIFFADWQPVATEPPGFVNLSRRAATSNAAPACVLARRIVDSARNQTVKLALGYSDDVTVFLNGRPVYFGRSGYRSRDPSYVGALGFNDLIHLPLNRGRNEICLRVADRFGGWGFAGRLEGEVTEPVREHQRLTKVWETPASFQIPESVLYDPEREVLYVSSFNRLRPGSEHAGFISKLTLDGTIEQLEWVTGLDGPCGLGLHGDTLYVVECSGQLVAIDPNRGQILGRYPTPGSSFLNDVSVSPDGIVYISNTSQDPYDIDVYAFDGQRCTVWKQGDDLHRANGIFVHDGGLIVGSTGGGLLRRVDLASKATRTITCLGAGVIDGIRIGADGRYLVSHWEGPAYSISPEGEVIEIGDLQPDGLNCADFEFIKDRNLLVVPTFLGNKVVAYRL